MQIFGRMFSAEANIRICCEVKDKLGAFHAGFHTVGIEKVPFDQSESSVVQRGAEKFPLPGGEVVVSDNLMPERQQAVGQSAADKARASSY